ncbi:MAG: ATP-dependent Clp protease ATP-binding subunit [Verrucomicrobia bacterium]|nr:ATP-dependent Clp protease ATP-binding subunit [Verrucomicrobiota bacterium]
MPRHADSLILVWRLADIEAAHLKSAHLDPTHFFIGLCKVVDLDLASLFRASAPADDELEKRVKRDVEQLRAAFAEIEMDAAVLRRKLRRRYADHHDPSPVEGHHRRSPDARRVFGMAERLAETGDDTVRPAHLRPEFFNRITETIVFQPLQSSDVRLIIDQHISRINRQLMAKGFSLKLNEDACDLLLREGFSNEFGAREMERTIERLIARPLANLVLSGAAHSRHLVASVSGCKLMLLPGSP